MSETPKELLPCPFCGVAGTYGHYNQPFASCDNDACLVEVSVQAGTKDEVAALWNRRAPVAAPTLPVEVIDACRAMEIVHVARKMEREIELERSSTALPPEMEDLFRKAREMRNLQECWPETIDALLSTIRTLQAQLAETDERAVAWAKIATGILSELRMDYAPLTTTDFDGIKMVLKLRAELSRLRTELAERDKGTVAGIPVPDSLSLTVMGNEILRLRTENENLRLELSKTRWEEIYAKTE